MRYSGILFACSPIPRALFTLHINMPGSEDQMSGCREFRVQRRRGELPDARKSACLVIDNPIFHKYGLDKQDGLGAII